MIFENFSFQLKDSVRCDGISPALCWIFWCLNEYARQSQIPIIITSISDGKHVVGSRHYSLEAIDIRSKNFPTRESKREFRSRFELILGEQFRVLLESEGRANEHFHVQVKKGMEYP